LTAKTNQKKETDQIRELSKLRKDLSLRVE